MKSSSQKRTVVLVLVGLALAYAGYWAGSNRAVTKSNSSAAAGAAPSTGKRILYWHDPMVPGKRFDRPGKSPFMDMQLVPVYADEGAAEGGVKVASTLQQNLGIRFGTVRRAEARDSFETIGTTQFDESVAEVVQSRVTGYIDHLYARAPMQRIKRGEPIASLFVPDWIAPQEEFLTLKRSGNLDLVAAARRRMQALSIPNTLIAQAERTGQAQRHLTLTSPATGVITELPVRDGAMVSPGMTVAKVAGLGKLWLIAEVPEVLVNSARPGMTVEATFAGDANRKYTGHVREILPGISTATRTVQARLELDNRDGSLTPGMLMRVRLGAETPVSRLLVPTEAVITSGTRTVVLVAGDNNSMQPVAVTVGRDTGNDTEILSGLTEGQKVVVSGQFLIDSEANLKAVLPKFSADAPTAPRTQSTQAKTSTVYHGVGKVEKVTAEALTLSHKPIPEMKWGAMTMDFNKPRPDAFEEIKVGDDIEFSFKEGKAGYVLESATPADGGKK
jgi:Cu(I)/Ag(I) efflux system membrane fusion protein